MTIGPYKSRRLRQIEEQRRAELSLFIRTRVGRAWRSGYLLGFGLGVIGLGLIYAGLVQ